MMLKEKKYWTKCKPILLEIKNDKKTNSSIY